MTEPSDVSCCSKKKGGNQRRLGHFALRLAFFFNRPPQCQTDKGATDEARIKHGSEFRILLISPCLIRVSSVAVFRTRDISTAGFDNLAGGCFFGGGGASAKSDSTEVSSSTVSEVDGNLANC